MADDLRYGFKAWRESTSTSPPSRYPGYYRSIMAYETPPDNEDTPRGSDRIFDVLASLGDSA
jgi:hypothetical protein